MLKSTFADNVGTKPASLKSILSSCTKQSATIPTGNVHPTNAGETATADNVRDVAQNGAVFESSKSFNHTLSKKIMTKTFQDAQADKKGKKQDQSSCTLSEMVHSAKSSVVQGELAQSVVINKVANAKIPNRLQQQAESQIQGKFARLVAGSNLPDSPQKPSLVVQAAKTITSEPDQIVSATTRPINKPVQPTIVDQGQTKSEIISGLSNKLPIPNAQFEKDKNIGKTQISDKTFVAKEKLVSQENGKELLQEARFSNSKTITVDKKPIVTDNALVSESPKTQLSNASSAAPLDQSSHLQQKMVLLGQKITAQAAEQTTPRKVDIDQKDRNSKTGRFELPVKDVVQVGNLSVQSIAQKMNPQQMRLSDTHAEIRNNVSEQPLGNSVQPVITEQSQTSASAAFAKIAGNASSDAGVGSQIQESIQSSFQSGGQQIVIRLNPPELGKVTIKFAERSDDITGLLQVDKPQTKDQIQQAIPGIIQNLQDCGIAIKKLEVVLTNQQEQYTLKDQSSTAGQDSWAGQQSSPNPESQGNNTIYSEWQTNIDNIPEYMEPQIQLTGNSINVLV